RRDHCRQLRGGSPPCRLARRLLRGAAAARALPVQARREHRRALAPDAAGELAARARPFALPADRAAAATARGGRLAGHADRDGLAAVQSRGGSRFGFWKRRISRVNISSVSTQSWKPA